MTNTPTTEPTVVTAGDTLRFTKNLPDYLPADGWVLSYALVNSAGNIEIVGSDNGDGLHLVEVLPAATADWSAGSYRWQSYLSDGTDRYTHERGQMEVKADFSALTDGVGLDARGRWQTILDNLETAFAQMSAGEIKAATVNIGDRVVTLRSLEELIKAMNHARQQAAQESSGDALSAGLGVRIHTRF